MPEALSEEEVNRRLVACGLFRYSLDLRYPAMEADMELIERFVQKVGVESARHFITRGKARAYRQFEWQFGKKKLSRHPFAAYLDLFYPAVTSILSNVGLKGTPYSVQFTHGEAPFEVALGLYSNTSRTPKIANFNLDFFVQRGRPCVVVGNYQQFNLKEVAQFREKTSFFAFEYLIRRTHAAFPDPARRYALNPRHHYYNVRALHAATLALSLVRKEKMTDAEYWAWTYGKKGDPAWERVTNLIKEEEATIRRQATGHHHMVLKRAGYKRKDKRKYFRSR